MIDLKGAHHPKSVILYAVYFYVRYAVSYRDLEEILAERGVKGDHATLNRWVVKFSPLIAAQVQARKRPTATSWRADETCIKVEGSCTYLYRAVDRNGQTLDFMLSERRNLAAARRFFKRAIEANGTPERVVIDKSGANLAGLQAVNMILKFTGRGRVIVTCHWSFIQPRPEPVADLRLSAWVEQSPGARNFHCVQRDGRLRRSGAGRSLRGFGIRGLNGAFRCCSR